MFYIYKTNARIVYNIEYGRACLVISNTKFSLLYTKNHSVNGNTQIQVRMVTLPQFVLLKGPNKLKPSCTLDWVMNCIRQQ